MTRTHYITPLFYPSETECDYVAIPLRRRDGSARAWTVVDVADLPLVLPHKWSLTSNGYVARYGGGGRASNRKVLLHRVLLSLPERMDDRSGLEGDHKNRNRLDNRRSNLRAIPHAGNGQNLALFRLVGFRGVHFDKRNGKWEAYFNLERKRHFVGYFSPKEEAILVVSVARRANLEFSIEEETSHAG